MDKCTQLSIMVIIKRILLWVKEKKDLKAHHSVGEVTYRGELSKFPPKFYLTFLCHPKPLGKCQERLFELERDKKLPKEHIGTHIASFLVVHSIHMIK